MSDATAHTSAKPTVPAWQGRLVDLLSILGSVREAFDPADKELKEFNEAIVWLVREIHLETGLSHGEVFVSIYYLATYGHFEGFDRTDAGPYGRLDLRHLPRTFHTLDRDGTTARLWRGLYRNWSIIRTLCEGCLEARRPTSEALPANMSLAEAPASAETSKEDHEIAGRLSAVNGRHPDGLEGGRWLRWCERRPRSAAPAGREV
jgi:hypothetical protein